MVEFFRPKIVTTNAKVDRREVGNEKKALKAAQLDRAIEQELLERLKQVSEGEIYNYPEKQYSRALAIAEKKFSKSSEADAEFEEEDGEDEEEGAEEEFEEDGEDGEEDYNVEYIEDFEESDEEIEVEDAGDNLLELYEKVQESRKKRKSGGAIGGGVASAPESGALKKKKGAKIEIEYENEEETAASSSVYNF